MLIDNVSNNSQ